jgi:hypothetical protein
MILLFELLIAVFMEKKTKKNSRNSSKPSSQTGKDETSKGSGTNGKGTKWRIVRKHAYGRDRSDCHG